MDNYDRQILALTDTELERFVREWIDHKTSDYVEMKRFSGAGDLGRDVVGFLSVDRHEGAWHNYQCKQYSTTLQVDVALLEIGKILYYAHLKNFTAPAKYFFVAPRGANRKLEGLIDKPTTFKSTLIAEWDQYCAHKIISKKNITLNQELKAFIDAYDFCQIHRVTIDEILLDPQCNPVLFNWFGKDPGPAPKGVPPEEVTEQELPYIRQLVEAYSDRDNENYEHHKVIGNHGNHLARQRERFYDADEFSRFYRDNTDPDVLNAFREDIFHGVAEVHDADHVDALMRADAVMSQAAKVAVAGPLLPHARVPVKQGICHHFANEGRLRWHK